jgi:inward rectifier potassium channel
MGPGVVRYDWRDPYHLALAVPVRWFLGLLLISYLGINLIFAALYAVRSGSVANADSFADAFFFSVQTFATVGYGRMAPQTTYGNIVASVEIFTGMIWLAVTAGVVFVRFSRPRSRLSLARCLVIGPGDDGAPALIARLVNRRPNPLYGVETRMLLRTRRRDGDDSAWQVRDLPLVRDRSPVEWMSWKVAHTIDASSPLAGLDAAALTAMGALIVVSVSAIEDTTMAPVHAARVFYPADILFNHAFADVTSADPSGRLRFDLTRVDQVVALTAGPDRPGG